MNFTDEVTTFTKADADLIARHQSDVDKLASHNKTTAKAVEDEKERVKKARATQETLARARQKLETAVMESGDATRRLEGSVPRQLLQDASQASVDARHAAAECRQVEGYVATCALSLERLRAPASDPKKSQGGVAQKEGFNENTITAAEERLARAQMDLTEHRERVQKATEKALRFDLAIAKAKEEILANARRTA